MAFFVFLFLAVLGLVGSLIAFRAAKAVEARKARLDQAAIKAGLENARTTPWSGRDMGGVYRLVGRISLGVCGLMVVLAISRCIVVVDAGHRGVVVTLGSVDLEPLAEGVHLVAPHRTVVPFSVRIERAENKYVAETSDTQSVTATIQMNWRPDVPMAAVLYRDYGETYADKIITPALNEAVRAEISRHKVTDLISQRPAIRSAVQASVAEWIRRHHLILVEMAVGDIDFSLGYDQAIEAKQVEEQRAAAKIYELRGVQTEAEKRAAQAKGEADALRVAAQGEADALRLRGEAQADYNRRVSESLTPLLVDRMKLEKWDGRLPVYMLGDAAPLIALPEGKGK